MCEVTCKIRCIQEGSYRAWIKTAGWLGIEEMGGGVENVWKKVYKFEPNSLAVAQHLATAAKKVLQRVPDEVTRQQIAMEIDQTLQHLPDFSDQHRRPQRRLNWVAWKRDDEKLAARVNRLKDITKAMGKVADGIHSALSDMLNHLQASMEADDGTRELSDLQNHLRRISKDAAEISNES